MRQWTATLLIIWLFTLLMKRTFARRRLLGGHAVLRIRAAPQRTPGIFHNIHAFRKSNPHKTDVSVQEVQLRKRAAKWFSQSTPQTLIKDEPRRPNLRQGLDEAQRELNSLKQELQFLKQQIAKLLGEPEPPSTTENNALEERRARFAKIAQQTEQWAEHLLFGNHKDDASWTRIECQKMLRGKYNADNLTSVFLKYMKDTRPDRNDNDNTTTEWPCLRMYTTIQAPMDEVCLFLSRPENTELYNSLIAQHEDLEELSDHSKICFGQTPQILFVKPRRFITFCSFRYRPDGTQVIVNQALDRYHGNNNLTATAFALRGATFLQPDPHHPQEHTRLSLLCHASPGSNLPQWACHTALSSLLPIEPYKLFHRINTSILQARPTLQNECLGLEHTTASCNNNNKKNERDGPAGMASLGFACFWPNGRQREWHKDDDDTKHHPYDSSTTAGSKATKKVTNKKDATAPRLQQPAKQKETPSRQQGPSTPSTTTAGPALELQDW